ncbi:MAG: hypothetical protein Tp185DCM00d2C31949971_65 [Prokaryotic dsDNA virus sp.]|uniref:hypothetical protein n=1 Tax=Gammaproteobacteria TaxID=1236 RepID=UPI000C555871|nr:MULTISPECIES: hypothetical protein [Gammaproteobacteria]MBP58938.1 hypothetical protein [Idiomarina sp.]QDP60949.1 MAG: hypothetical protein Tp185DCM00d2C31949971_65 [Prokaryotic dsDNA virus sp.]QDP61781.1 MAG: hypothetical protein Tp1111MES1053591_20 [Prokaryotic dsDNA virus sp.]HCC80414.1 hypothetical protein [Methylophaga sp.]|tara:strand:- start:226 stop:426 length:201 start_codon:yes stop_codon:yes gene_type:complete
MSKIIIHNNSSVCDSIAIDLVGQVTELGFISGEMQYCWITTADAYGIEIHAKKTRGTTHTFEVRDL